MTSQKFGVALTQESSTQLWPLGTLHVDEVGNHYRYFLNTSAAATNYLIYTYDPDTWTLSSALTTTVAAAGECHPLCCPQTTFTASYYFWCFVGPGRATFTCNAAVAAQSLIKTSAGAGKIDDASAGKMIYGLITYDAFSSATDTGICKASNEMYVVDL